MLERYEHAVKLRRAIQSRRLARGEKLRDVRTVVCVFTGLGRGANAGSKPERRDDEARVVGDRR